MSDESKIPEVLEVATTAIVAGATAGATLSAIPAAGLALVPALVGGIAKGAIAAYGRHQQKKAERWFQLVADLWEVGSAQEAAKVIDENIDEPWAHESVVEGVRGVLNGIDDVALPALAKIVARGLKAKKPPSRDEKQAIQLLCDCDPTSYKGLTDVVALCKRIPTSSGLRLTVTAEKGDYIHMLYVHEQQSKSKLPFAKVVPPAGCLRAFFLLKKHEFGFEGNSGTYGSSSGPQMVDISGDEIAYLAQVLL